MEPQLNQLLRTGREVLAIEAQALQQLADNLGSAFEQACELILACSGRVIVTGMGKSGHIGQKITASLTSTGTAAHFLHPAEGVHGDLGVVHKSDCLIAISYSGETAEILNLMGPVIHLGIPVIAITGQPDSTLAKQSSVVLELGKVAEADVHDLVPTTSTTLTLALGDALTVALMQARGFTPEEFAVFHPSGSLGRRLTLKVGDLLLGDETNPVIYSGAPFSDALAIITKYTLGGTCVVGENSKLCGILTDGDVRRVMLQFASQGGSVADVMSTPVSSLMTAKPVYCTSNTLAHDALQMMENHQPRPVFILPVIDTLQRPVGMLHLHALVQAGFKTRAVSE